MSHFTRIKTQIKDLEVLKKCLTAMGHQVAEGRQRLSGYQAKQTDVDLTVRMPAGYHIGFARTADGAYDVVADWWGVKGPSQQDFAAELQREFEEVDRQIRRRYSLDKVTAELRKNKFTIVEQKQEADGTVKLLARRFG
jgi:hypothetical protein